jgi:hypothetical protein
MVKQEIFRIFLNSARSARDPDEESSTIGRIRVFVLNIFRPLRLNERPSFTVEVSQSDMSQWLVVSVSETLQRNLFDTMVSGRFTQNTVGDASELSAIQAAYEAFLRLQQLVHRARLNSADFLAEIEDSASNGLSLIASLTDGLKMRTADGRFVSISSLAMPRRKVIDETVTVSFRVKLVGVDEAQVAISGSERKHIHANQSTLPIHWTELEQPNLSWTLMGAALGRKYVTADVQRVIDRAGWTKSLILEKLH